MKFMRFFWFLILSNGVAQAALEITVVKKNEDAFPIAISAFELIGEGTQNQGIANIIRDDLERSGRFNAAIPSRVIDKFDAQYWMQKNIEALIVGSLEKKNNRVYKLSVSLYDVYSNAKLFTQNTEVDVTNFRQAAHHISDKVYEALLGENGSFNTLLTYVTVKKGVNGRTYQLNIADADAKNNKSRIKLNTPILSPAWSPERNNKNKKIAYVSFENGRSEVFIWYPFVRKKIIKLPRFDGIASSPSWHPNGESLVLTLSKKGNKDIYAYNLKDKQFKRLTKHKGVDTEASYSADGTRLVFTSNRSGQPQIYIKNLNTGRINRVTFEGHYNTKATFSPSGRDLLFVHRLGKEYRIAMQNIKSGELSIMSYGNLDESPSFSPNGDMIIFSAQKNNKGVLSVVSTKGNRAYKLESYDAEVRDPNWSK